MIAAESHKNKMENYIVAFYRHTHTERETQDKRAKAVAKARSKNVKYLRAYARYGEWESEKECLCEIGWDFERQNEIDKRQAIRKTRTKNYNISKGISFISRRTQKQRQGIPENEQHWIIHGKKRIAPTTTKEMRKKWNEKQTSEYAAIGAQQQQQQHFVWKSRSNGRNSYRLWKSNGRHHAHTHNWRLKQ